MKYTVRFTPEAEEDLVRLYAFLLEKDPKTAEEALNAIANGLGFLRDFPFSCRKALPENPLLRELLVSYGKSGYVALFEIEDQSTVTVLALRYQQEDDYY